MVAINSHNHDDDFKIEALRKKAKFLIMYRAKKEAEEILKQAFLNKINDMDLEQLKEVIEFLQNDDFEIIRRLLNENY